MSSVWPFPSTPAMPTISPARTSSETPRTFSTPRSSWTLQPVDPRGASRRASISPFSTSRSTSRPTIRLARLSSRRAFGRQRRDQLAPAQHGDAVGDLEHLVELVADEDDREPLVGQGAEDLEQLARLLGRQHRGRLVEDEDVRLAVERLEDLDALLLPDGDVLDERIRVDREAERPGELLHPGSRRPVVEQDPVPARLDPEDDVLRHRHHRDEHEVLVHHPDAVLDRVLRRVEGDVLAANPDLTLVGPVEAVEDVHQRRLAGPVLSEEGVHLTSAEIEVDVVVREDPGKALGDPLQLEDDRLVDHRTAILGGWDVAHPPNRCSYPSS